MSALRMIACRAVHLHQMSADDRRVLQKDAKFEAHSHGYWLSGCKHEGCCSDDPEATTPTGQMRQAFVAPYGREHKLTCWNRKLFSNPRRPGITERHKPLAVGSFADCCRELVNRITPSDYNPAE